MRPQADSSRSRRLYVVAALAVTLAALAFRLQGIWFGYPLAVHPDEHNLVERAWRMIWTKDLNPHFFIYPSVYIYAQVALQILVTAWMKLADGIRFSEIPLITFYLAGRALTVLLSAATVYLTFEVGRRLLHPLAGLAGSVFVAASYLHVTNSYLVTPDAPMAFWAMAACLMAVLAFERGPSLPIYLLAGAFAGLAGGTKYIAVFAILPLVVAHSRHVTSWRDWIDHRLVLAGLAVPAVLVATSPFILLDADRFLADMRGVTEHYRGGHAANEAVGDRSWHLYLGNLYREGYGMFPSLLAVAGLGWMAARRWRAALLVSSFPAVLLLFVGSYKVFFPRNVVPVVPFLAILSGAAVYAGVLAIRRRLRDRWGPLVLTLALVVTGTAAWGQAAAAQDRIAEITLPDTRVMALRWVEEHVPPGACITREGGTPVIENHTDAYRVTYLGYTGVFDRLEGAGCADYLVLSAFNYGRFLGNSDRYPEEAAAYLAFFEAHQPVAEFRPDGETVGGPTIRIYRLKS